MNFIADPDSRTQAIFVGEGSGGSPFHYGDSIEVPLARAELLLQISSRVHLSPIANDTRPAIPAAIETPLSSSQYYADRGPALEALLAD